MYVTGPVACAVSERLDWVHASLNVQPGSGAVPMPLTDAERQDILTRLLLAMCSSLQTGAHPSQAVHAIARCAVLTAAACGVASLDACTCIAYVAQRLRASGRTQSAATLYMQLLEVWDALAVVSQQLQRPNSASESSELAPEVRGAGAQGATGSRRALQPQLSLPSHPSVRAVLPLAVVIPQPLLRSRSTAIKASASNGAALAPQLFGVVRKSGSGGLPKTAELTELLERMAGHGEADALRPAVLTAPSSQEVGPLALIQEVPAGASASLAGALSTAAQSDGSGGATVLRESTETLAGSLSDAMNSYDSSLVSMRMCEGAADDGDAVPQPAAQVARTTKLECLKGLAGCLFVLNQPKAELDILGRLLAAREREPDGDYTSHVILLRRMACCKATLNDGHGAIATFHRCIKAGVLHLGPDHPVVRVARIMQANVYVQLGDRTTALAIYEAYLPAVLAVNGPAHSLVTAAQYGMASCLREGDQHAHAATVFQTCGRGLQAAGQLTGAQAAFDLALQCQTLALQQTTEPLPPTE